MITRRHILVCLTYVFPTLAVVACVNPATREFGQFCHLDFQSVNSIMPCKTPPDGIVLAKDGVCLAVVALVDMSDNHGDQIGSWRVLQVQPERIFQTTLGRNSGLRHRLLHVEGGSSIDCNTMTAKLGTMILDSEVYFKHIPGNSVSNMWVWEFRYGNNVHSGDAFFFASE